MRRCVVIVLMLFMPLQWTWSVAASLCGHEAGPSHFGHHAHDHVDAAAGSDGSGDGAAADRGEAGVPGSGHHADCHTCHLPIGCVDLSCADRHPAPADIAWPAGADALPEPPIEALFRPPLPLAAFPG